MIYTKLDNQLQVIKDGNTYTYTREFLNSQVTAITTQRDEMIALKEAELAEVNLLLAKCDELEITE